MAVLEDYAVSVGKRGCRRVILTIVFESLDLGWTEAHDGELDLPSACIFVELLDVLEFQFYPVEHMDVGKIFL